MKKFIFAVAAVLAVSMMFTACGKKDEAKEAARKQLEAILKQAEENAQ